VKKVKKSAGVKCQYSGTAGRKENCQVGVFLAYSTSQGHVLVDRELYLPQDWIEDRARCREAHIPVEVGFVTKPQKGLQMLKWLGNAELPAKWVTGDTVYGGCGYLRRWLQEQRRASVMALACNDGVDIISKGVVCHHVPIKDFVHNVITEWHRRELRGLEPRANAGLIGPSSPWPLRALPDGNTGCWFVVISKTKPNGHITWSLLLPVVCGLGILPHFKPIQ
jgi:hypothetical protein